jgi:hypothetical protein
MSPLISKQAERHGIEIQAMDQIPGLPQDEAADPVFQDDSSGSWYPVHKTINLGT